MSLDRVRSPVHTSEKGPSKSSSLTSMMLKFASPAGKSRRKRAGKPKSRINEQARPLAVAVVVVVVVIVVVIVVVVVVV